MNTKTASIMKQHMDARSGRRFVEITEPHKDGGTRFLRSYSWTDERSPKQLLRDRGYRVSGDWDVPVSGGRAFIAVR